MKLNKESAEIFIPDNQPVELALKRTTHLGIGAHQDDIEIMALSGILDCFQKEDRWFGAVAVTDGRGSPRDALYKDYTDEEMRIVRIKEQKKAAVIGEYSVQFLLDYSSSDVKSGDTPVVEDLISVLKATTPKIVYTHNLADKHDTHVAVTLRVIEAIRSLSEEYRPEKLFGCEVWRDLDWMMDEDKVAFEVSAHENLQAALLGVFDSQIAGGKRYDLATMGRRRANATYFASHGTDIATGMIFAMDLTPLVTDPNMDIAIYINGFVERFSKDIASRLVKLGTS